MRHYKPLEIDEKVHKELGEGWGGVKLGRCYVTINRTLGLGGVSTQATTLERSIELAKAEAAAHT